MSSFSVMIKNEISQKQFDDCCQKTILAAFIKLNAFFLTNTKQERILKLSSGHYQTICFIKRLLKQQLSLTEITVSADKIKNKIRYELEFVVNHAIFAQLSLNSTNLNYLLFHKLNRNCLRAYIIGVFISIGSINSPYTANYHLELQFKDELSAKVIQKKLAKVFALKLKIINRRNKYVLYLKKSNDISDFLKLLDCSEAVFMFEDKRITRELFNTINRFNNIDISNQQKTLTAGLQQVEMIKILKTKNIFATLSPKCQTLANIRLNNEDASLLELSIIYYEITGKKISKSGVNHLIRELKKKYQEIS